MEWRNFMYYVFQMNKNVCLIVWNYLGLLQYLWALYSCTYCIFGPSTVSLNLLGTYIGTYCNFGPSRYCIFVISLYLWAFYCIFGHSTYILYLWAFYSIFGHSTYVSLGLLWYFWTLYRIFGASTVFLGLLGTVSLGLLRMYLWALYGIFGPSSVSLGLLQYL